MPRGGSSPPTGMLREAQAAVREARARNVPIDEVTEMRAERPASVRVAAAEGAEPGITRRDFLRGAAATGAAIATARVLRPTRSLAATQPRIVIVGGGLAGVHCAHELWKSKGYTSTVYEADSRVGGRVDTLRNYFANGQIVEQHGEFISSEHTTMLNIVSSMGLSLDNANTYPRGKQDVYWFNGGYYTQAQLNADWQSFGWALFNNAVKAAPWPTRYNSFNQAASNYDHMSVVDFITQKVPGGMSSKFGKLCYEDAISEYGGPPESQSALNLIYVLGYNDSGKGKGYQPKSSPVLAGTDEKWHIKGGNDQIIDMMVNRLPAGTVKTGQRLVALKNNGNNTYTCTFSAGASTYQVIADHVVLAIPFTTLRHVDLSQANLSSLKMTAINNLPLGSNGKIQLQFNGKPWNTDGFTGNTLADNGAEGSWEVTNYQSGTTGILVDFPGGTAGANLGTKYGLAAEEGPAPAAMVTDTLAALEPIFPGVTAAYNGKAYYHTGMLNPNLGGAWSQYNIGQYTRFSGIEPVREGNIHFAGEHTSLEYQGFMEGAVRSAVRAAGEI